MAEGTQGTLVAHSVEERIAGLGWEAASDSLSERGYAVTAPILSPE